MRPSTSLATFSALSLAYVASQVSAQYCQSHNLTPDGFWHNMYHGRMAMAAYGNYNQTCGAAFTKVRRPRRLLPDACLSKFKANELKNFPNSKRPPWTVLNSFGPTPSGCKGFTAIVPEMNKQLIVFEGNYAILETLSPAQVPFDVIGVPQCAGCMMNAQAAQAYLECKAETNNFEILRNSYIGSGMVFSVVGHGFGGMLAQIAGVDFNNQQLDYYNHALGAPLVFNQAGANWFNCRFNGEAGERATYGNDQIPLMFRNLSTYAVSGTQFYYGPPWNYTGGGPSMTICWAEDGQTDDPACFPHATGSSTAIEDHWYYSTNVQRCDGEQQQTWVADQWIANNNNFGIASSAAPSSSSMPPPTPSSSSARPTSTLQSASLATPLLAASAYPSSVFVTYSAKSAGVISAALSPLSVFFAALAGALVL